MVMSGSPPEMEKIYSMGLLAPEQVAEALALDRRSKNPRRIVLEMARRGELQAARIGRWTFITKKSLERYLSDLNNGPSAN